MHRLSGMHARVQAPEQRPDCGRCWYTNARAAQHIGECHVHTARQSLLGLTHRQEKASCPALRWDTGQVARTNPPHTVKAAPAQAEAAR